MARVYYDTRKLHRKEDIAKLQTKQKSNARALQAKEKQILKFCRGVFLKSLGTYTVAKIQEKNPKTEIYVQSLTSVKDEWEKIWSKTENRTLKIVKFLNVGQQEGHTILEHWERVLDQTARCKFDELSADEIEKTLAVAAFTKSMKR